MSSFLQGWTYYLYFRDHSKSNVRCEKHLAIMDITKIPRRWLGEKFHPDITHIMASTSSHWRRNDNPHPQLRYHSSFLFLRDCIRFCFSTGERRFTDCTILSKFSIAWVLSPLSATSSFSFCPSSSGYYRLTLPQISPSPPSRWTPSDPPLLLSSSSTLHQNLGTFSSGLQATRPVLWSRRHPRNLAPPWLCRKSALLPRSLHLELVSWRMRHHRCRFPQDSSPCCCSSMAGASEVEPLAWSASTWQ